MSERFHIVFVCTGNICRSPMAEAMVRDALDSAGLGGRVEVESAGTGGWHAGDGMDPRAAAELESLGIDSEHSAQQIDDRLLGADLLVALDSGHERALRHAGADPERIRMLRSFDPDAHGLDVADPYYGSALDFRTVRHQIAAAAPGIVEFVREQTS
ncbi:low molecular weight protein-tyrosine-phosphatase [Dietzia sp.]|uniref:low molecular weight protein-tyrosine-phosphatase n=1 Tax=Dietzia sp. TaxID=1871616 RepID=UPI002FDAD634